MTNEQLYLAIGVPLLFNGVIFIIMVTSFNARLTDLRAHVDTRFAAFEGVMASKFDSAHHELLRVEGVLDARLKHLEDARQ